MTKGAEIGLLHPGAMGHAVGAQAGRAGARVSWVSEGRSAASRRRAESAGFHDAGSLIGLVSGSEVILSICPPHAALDVARAVAGEGFNGLYVDANAVAPATAREIASVVGHVGGEFVDGGIVGPPPTEAGTTRLYLSGTKARRVADLFAGTALEAVAIGPEVGAASALKMCHAAYTKANHALLIAIRAVATAEGVEEPLLAEWALSQKGLAERSLRSVRWSTDKAWRYAGEMREVAKTFEAQGISGTLHRGAAELYDALDVFKDRETPSLEEVVRHLLRAKAR